MAYPVQVIADTASVGQHIYDWRGATPEEQKTWADELMQSRMRQPFDLTAGALLRIDRALIDAEQQLVLLSAPAFCLDWQGMQNVLADLVACYATGAYPTPEEELPISYSAVSEWWNEMLETEEGEFGLAYWKKYDLSPVLQMSLVAEQMSSGESHFQPNWIEAAMEPSVAERIRHVAEDEGVSLPAVLHSAWQVLLERVTGQDSYMIGTACDGRSDEDLASVPGLFGKYVPVRCESDQGCTFRARIGRTDRAIRAVQEWQDSFSWEHQLVDVSTAQEPYFPFGFDCLSTQTVAGGGLSVSLLSGSSCIDRFDVRLSALQVADGLQIRLYFDASRYSEQEMQHLLNAYVVLVKHAVSAPDRAVAELGLLEKSEREQLLTSMQDTRVDFDTALRLHELFEAQVNRTPQQVAVTFGEESLTYAELNLKANRLARRLVNLGVGRGNYVGIFVERSLEMVIALLATLKAGAAYVPLDPSYPQDRIDFMVKDAQLSVLLTLKRLEEKISHMQTRVVNLDALDTQDASDGQTDADNLQIEISAEDPAYVIYTSGTTGQPKGVVVPHRAICNHMLWMQEAFPLQLGDSVLQKTPFSFDASVWEFYAPLLAGAELVIAEPGRHMDTSYLSDVIRNRTITTLQLVPTLLQMLLDEPDFASCMNLQRVFCGGEALTPELVARFFQAFPENVDLINLYGPTECCIDSTYHICEPGSRLRTVPIGKPIANAQALVLDERMQPVPVGVLGELYISGVGVALGYLHRPELTAERFVRHVFEESSEQTHLLYKTGDQVRRLSDGNLEYVGRADDQVKVRGFRIELGEIEKVIAQHDEVREAVVIAHEYSPGDKRLVGYFVPEAKAKPVVDHLRDHLKGKLPDYMVPANLVILDELPLSPSGKVNRKALPIPELDSQQKQETYIAPRNPVEELLERIFGQVLHHEKVGVHDNFFDLGGHSLLATQVVSRIRNAFQIALPVSELFDDPTISGLGERVQRAMNEGHSLQEHPIQTASREQELPLSFAQQRLWFLDQLDPGAATYNVPIALRLRGPLDFEALERSLGEIVRRHESLRTTFAEKDGQAVQVIAEPTPFVLPMLDLAAHSDMDRNTIVAQWLEEEINWSFNLVKGPLFRSRLLHLEAEEAVLFLNLHHIVTDGWSMTVFVQELSALYEAFCQGKASPLPDLQVQYADFAVWQRDWLQGDELDRQLTYWTEKLGGDLPVLQLPTDRPRSKRQTYRGSFHSFVVAAPLAGKIKTVSKREEATLFMTLLAVYKTLLYRYTGQEDLLVGTPIANRNRREIEGVIGFFVNTLVLRTDLSGNPTFSELVHRLRKVALGAYAHQELPFEKLVEELQPERDMSHSPLFQAMFTLQNHSSQTMQLSGLECELIDTEFDISKFDLSLFAHEQGDELVCGFEYNTDLFDTATIERMSGHFLTLLEAVAEDPGRSIALLPMITTAEQQQLAGWNETDQPLSTLCLPQLFEEQVNRTPDAIALQT
ncbi:MAG: amino acid adenylation domain-containing protein, partial [Tumebacillaceae bacterium]